MGNCSVKGFIHGGPNFVRVVMDSGNILEFKTPIFVGEVVKNHQGCGIFPKHHCQRHNTSPLPEDELLVNGQLYYLLPLEKVPEKMTHCDADVAEGHMDKVKESKPEEGQQQTEEGQQQTEEGQQQIDPPKMSSADFVEKLSDGPSSALEVLPLQRNGVWRVKLVISTKQLEEILSEQGDTEALIEKMRMAAVNSGGLTPRRSKSSWFEGWKPVLSNVFKVSNNNGK